MATPGLRGLLPPLAPEDRYPLKWAHEYLKALPYVTFPIDTRAGITALGMQDNDNWGDCVEAGEVHQEMTTAVYAGTGFTPDPHLALQRAQQYAGFPSNPPGPGTDMPTYYHQLWLAGLIKAWAPVNVTDKDTMLGLMQAGFGLQIGVSLCPINQQQFQDDQPWDPAGETPDPEDGHCVLWSFAQGPDGPYEVGTWGVWWPASEDWIDTCLVNNPSGQAYLLITTEEQLAKFEPDLVADLEAIGGGDSPQATPQQVPILGSVIDDAVDDIKGVVDDIKGAIRETVRDIDDVIDKLGEHRQRLSTHLQ